MELKQEFRDQVHLPWIIQMCAIQILVLSGASSRCVQSRSLFSSSCGVGGHVNRPAKPDWRKQGQRHETYATQLTQILLGGSSSSSSYSVPPPVPPPPPPPPRINYNHSCEQSCYCSKCMGAKVMASLPVQQWVEEAGCAIVT